MSSRQAELEKELFRACKVGDVDRVHTAIAAGVDPKTEAIGKDTFSGDTPLHTACRYGLFPEGSTSYTVFIGVGSELWQLVPPLFSDCNNELLHSNIPH